MAYSIASYPDHARRPIIAGLAIAVSMSLLLWAIIAGVLLAIF